MRIARAPISQSLHSEELQLLWSEEEDDKEEEDEKQKINLKNQYRYQRRKNAKPPNPQPLLSRTVRYCPTYWYNVR